MPVKAKTTKFRYLLKLYVNKGKVSVKTIENLKIEISKIENMGILGAAALHL